MDKKKNIPGIHNYCNRWCERCSFTSRCAVYENTSKLTPEENDINNKAFWENISNSLAGAFKMLEEKAKEFGIDLNAITNEEMKAYEKECKKRQAKEDKHPLIIAAKSYSDKAGDLIEKYELLVEKGMEMIQEVELGIKTVEQYKKELAEMRECHEVVSWYVFQIFVKLKRAMSSLDDEWGAGPEIMYDANGSAKVALIGAERSLAAWQKLMAYIPATEDETIGLLALLQKIIVLTEKTFPGARKFKRPGFDDK